MSSSLMQFLKELLDSYRLGKVDVKNVVDKLHQLYWNMSFETEADRSRFFEAVFEIEQVVASNIDMTNGLNEENVRIIDRSIEILYSFVESALR